MPDWHWLADRSRGLKVVALLLTALVVFAVAWLAHLQDIRKAYRLGAKVLSELGQAYQDKSRQVQRLGPAQRALAQSVEQLRDARWRLGAGEGMSELLEQLANSGHAHGVLFEQLDVLDEEKLADYWTAPLRMDVLGSYAALRAWLDEWLGQVRLLRPSSLQVAPAQGRAGLLRLSLRVHAYHAGEELQVPASLAHEPARPAARPALSDPFQPWSARLAVDGLARVPLAQLKMVGSLSRGGRYQALLWASGRLYRVRPGDRVGRGEGVVARIDEQQVEVLERVFLGGAWQQRSTYLALRKRAGRGSMDEPEAIGDVGDGDDPGDSGGGGEDLPG